MAAYLAVVNYFQQRIFWKYYRVVLQSILIHIRQYHVLVNRIVFPRLQSYSINVFLEKCGNWLIDFAVICSRL